MNAKLPKIPRDFPVQPLRPGQRAKDRATCGACGRSWDDGIATAYTPAPGGRCPFEAYHATEPAPRRATGGALCFATGGASPYTGAPRGSQLIELRQLGRDSFTIRYGLQVKTRLSYGEAARELGECIMHACACDGGLDNQEGDEP